MITVRGDTRVGLGSRPHCVDWLGLWAEEEDGEGEDEEELEQREGGALEALEGLEESWLPRESHSCLNTWVTVPMSEVTAPSGGQVEVEGFWKESATSDELTPFSAKEPERRHEENKYTGQ